MCLKCYLQNLELVCIILAVINYLFSQKTFGKTNKFDTNLMVKTSIIKRTLNDLKQHLFLVSIA